MLNKPMKLIFILSLLLSILHAQKISFKGFEYKIITSPITKNIWLDRNLGALQSCESKTDTKCFGDYYQWGRKADGHEKANSKTILKRLQKHTAIYDKFINVKSKGNFDWNEIRNDNLWKTTLSENNVCPKGFKIPTISELESEVQNNYSFLNIPLSGYKSFCNGKLVRTSKQGALWSSSTYENDAYYLDIRNSKIEESTSSRADAFSVRCIKE